MALEVRRGGRIGFQVRRGGRVGFQVRRGGRVGFLSFLELKDQLAALGRGGDAPEWCLAGRSAGLGWWDAVEVSQGLYLPLPARVGGDGRWTAHVL